MKWQVLFPILVFTLVLGLSRTPGPTACPVTHCISLTSGVSLGVAGPGFQPLLSVVTVLQLVGIAAALSPSVIALAFVRRVAPIKVLQAANHLWHLGEASNDGERQTEATCWLPIESVSAGRITSKMTRGVAFFGPGRR